MVSNKGLGMEESVIERFISVNEPLFRNIERGFNLFHIQF